jgi:hypothetical protein
MMYMTKPQPKSKRMTPSEQLERFRAMAEEVGADEAPNALQRSFGRINPKAAKPIVKPRKPK